MSSGVIKSYTEFVVPPQVVTRTDVSRLVSELERVDSEMTTAQIHAGDGQNQMPQMSESLEAFLSANGLTLDDANMRAALIREVRRLKDKVPIIHMTFATAADADSLGRLVQWLRDSLHPQAVIAVGLQPALMAGVYVRTPNHVHDLSLKGQLREQHGTLVKQLEALGGSK